MENEIIKTMIKLAQTYEEVDKIITENTRFATTGEKLAYLFGMFDVSIIGSNGREDDEESDYRSVISTIINEKWR